MNVYSSRSAASSVILLSRAFPLCNSVEGVNDAHLCHIKRRDGVSDLQTLSCFGEGQFGPSPRNLSMVSPGVQQTFVRTFYTSHTCCTAHVDMKKCYYTVLGVTPQCSGVKIKQAYYRLSKLYHPDINKTEAAVKKFHEITEAYEILSSPSQRHQYDAGRRGHGHGLHRGVHKPGPTNFQARGPHQSVERDKYNYDAWMKEHYRDSLKEHRERLHRLRVDEQRIREKNEKMYSRRVKDYPYSTRPEEDFDKYTDAILKQAFISFCIVTVILTFVLFVRRNHR